MSCRLYILEDAPTANSVFVFTNQIMGQWTPHTDNTFLMESSSKMDGGVLVTYGQDSEQQMKSTFIKLWEVADVVDYSKLSKKAATQNTRRPFWWEPWVTPS